MVGIPRRLKGEGGFALAMAIFALVLLAAVVAGGYFSASQEYQIGRGMRSLTTSIYAGEAGINEILDDWDPQQMFQLAAGDTLTFGPTTLEGGGSYIGRVIRVGLPADSVKRYFYIETVGRPPLPSLGERRQSLVVRARYPRICCDAAMRAYDDVLFTGGGQERIYGSDSNVSAWGAICDPYTFGDTAGVNAGSPSDINKPSLIYGNPPVVSDYPGASEGQIFFPDYTWADLVALADHHLADGAEFNGSTMSVTNGECNREDQYNLGAPESTSHPCFEYFPVIHVNGTATFKAGDIQGIFLIEEDLHVQGPVDVYGIILVRNDLFMQGPSSFYGYGWVGDDVEFQGAVPRYYLSRCAAERSLRLSNFTRPVPVDGRAWAELF